MKKKWKFGLKVADSHSEPGNLQKLEEMFMFLSCFYHFFIIFFSFSLPVAPEIQESHEKQWKTIKNKGKWKKNEVANEKKMKIWTQSCRFSLRTRKSSKTRGNVHCFIIFLSFFIIFFIFFHFPCPWHLKSRKAMKNNEEQWKTIKNKGKWKKTWSCKWKNNEVANEKKWSCKWKKNEDKMKKMKIKWKKMMMKMIMKMNMKMKMKMKKMKNNNFWWSQTVAVRIL